MNRSDRSQLTKLLREGRHSLHDRAADGARATFSAALTVYRRLVPTKLRAIFPESIRRTAKKILGIKDPLVRVQKLRLRLNDLGFVERALADLNRVAESQNAVERQLAAWEIAVWHANRRSPEARWPRSRLVSAMSRIQSFEGGRPSFERNVTRRSEKSMRRARLPLKGYAKRRTPICISRQRTSMKSPTTASPMSVGRTCKAAAAHVYEYR